MRYIGEDRVCGRLSPDDPWRTLEGTFDAELHSTVVATVLKGNQASPAT